MSFREKVFLDSSEFCTGCGACVNKCPTDALTLGIGKDMTYISVFNPQKCINCNQCENICPILFDGYKVNHNTRPKILAVQMPKDVRMRCSSGGVFFTLAQKIILDGGVVYGAAWKSVDSVIHLRVDSIDELYLLTGSKYVQSYLGNVYCELLIDLKKERRVLFSGTPCQVAGLNSYLGKDYDNLITVDVLCFYSAGPGYFREYLTENHNKDEIVQVDFRDKNNGWSCEKMTVHLSNGQKIVKTRKDDIYQKALHNQLMISDHCMNCKFSTVQRQGDISLGDFWAAQKFFAECDDKGTSAVFINSRKGENLLNDIGFVNFQRTDFYKTYGRK